MSRWLLRVLVVVVIACSPVGLFHQHAARAGWRTVSDLAVDPDQFVACTDGLSFVVGDTNLDFTDPATLPDTLTHPFVAVSPPYDGSGPAPADLIVSPAGQTITLQKRPWRFRSGFAPEPTPEHPEWADVLDFGEVYFGAFTIPWSHPLTPGTTVEVSFDNIFKGGIGEVTAVIGNCDLYDFSGFYRPVQNYPAMNAVFLPGAAAPPVNAVRAGYLVPVTFSLHGFQGTKVLAAGFPQSRAIPCGVAAPRTTLEPTASFAHLGLVYLRKTDTYTYIWKTDAAWAGTCRQLVVTLADGTTHVANFMFH